MSSFKQLLYTIYIILFVVTVIGVLYNESLIASFGLETSNTIWMFWALLGFVLLVLESVVENIHLTRKSRQQARLAKENTELKAKLYDDITRVRERNEPFSTNPTTTTTIRPRERENDNPRPAL